MTTELEQYVEEAVGEENGQYGPGEQEVEEEYGQEAEVEGNGPQPTTPSGVRVESSLHGLVDELDKLRETLGYSNQLQAIEQHLQALQAENDELRSYAEEAIKEAERLANQNEELQSRLRQQELDDQMGAVLTETQKLKDVADEFEKDLVLQKLAESEERVVEIESLQGRVRELEEENVALTQTLNEYRESTEQLQRLRMLESGAEAVGYAAVGAAAGAQKRAAPLENGSVLPREARGEGSGGKKAAAFGAASPPRSPTSTSVSSAGGGSAAAASTRSAAAVSTRSAAAVSTRSAAAAPVSMRSGRDPARLAEQLAAAAGGADVGVVASAAKCLRDYASLEAALLAERQECERLRQEVDELRDTMFSKTFKPPSAWAEREVKYKMEKKAWEEQTKELSQRLGELENENEEYRAAGKVHEFEERIHELEAQLLQTERQKDDARAQLHELQISLRSISNAPEVQRFSPYKQGGAQPDSGEVVHGMVAELERHQIVAHAGLEPPGSVVGEAARRSLDLSADAAPEQEGADAGAGSVSSTPQRPPKSDKLRALAKDRAHAEAALEEHNKRSDVTSLRRSKAELETKVSMLEQQIGKMQWAIEHADQQQAAIEEQLDTALKTGDVKNLSTLREKLKAGLASPSRMFRRGKGLGPSPNKAAMSKQLHQTNDALRSSEAERNALRRQLAKLSRKYKAMAVVGTTGVAAGAAGADASGPRLSRTSLDSANSPQQLAGGEQSPDRAGGNAAAAGAAAAPRGAAADEAAVLAAVGALEAIDEFDTEELEEFLVPGIDDSEMEVLALREENELLMDHLVTTKVRLAETEGDFLRSKRELLRAKEKRQEVEERLQLVQQMQEQAQLLQPLGAGAAAMAATATLPSPAPASNSLPVSRGAAVVEERSLGGADTQPAPALSRDASASSVGGMATVAAPQSKRSRSWIGSLKL